LYAGDGYAPDDIYNAALQGAGAGYNTGKKAVTNASYNTAVSSATLGFASGGDYYEVTQQDIDNGYNLSYSIARGSTELLVGVGTGK